MSFFQNLSNLSLQGCERRKGDVTVRSPSTVEEVIGKFFISSQSVTQVIENVKVLLVPYSEMKESRIYRVKYRSY